MIVELKKAFADVYHERERQIAKKGYNAQHDDLHINGELALAAIAYASPLSTGPYSEESRIVQIGSDDDEEMEVWPWSDRTDTLDYGTSREKLVCAAALLIAEIERIDRLEDDGEVR